MREAVKTLKRQDAMKSPRWYHSKMWIKSSIVTLIATIAIAGVLSSLLFGLSARDPLTLGIVGAVLLVTALAACTAPAMRATRIDPVVALRDE